MRQNRVQCPFRLSKDKLLKVKVKIKEDSISFQKLMEIMLNAYLRNNKEIMKMVNKYASDKHVKRRRGELSDFEYENVLSIIEEKHSPLRDLELATKELEEEEYE